MPITSVVPSLDGPVRWTGNRAQVIGRTPKEIVRLRRAKEPILAEWARDLVVIVGERSALGKVA